MAEPTPKSDVRLLIGLASPEPALLEELTGRVALEFGEIALRSPRWTQSPGADTVARQWIALREPIGPADFPSLKRHALRVEELYKNPQGQPRIRLDVAYLDALRVVRATVADAAHRIYLGAGVFGEVILHWRDGEGFAAMSWTRPEDRAPLALEFMRQAREEWLLTRR